MVFTCCVRSCKNNNCDAPMHIFPKDLLLFNLWIKKVGRVDMKEKPMDYVRRNYRMCDIHFAQSERYIGSRHKSTIKVGAIPSLFLDEPLLEPHPVPLSESLISDDMIQEPQLGDISNKTREVPGPSPSPSNCDATRSSTPVKRPPSSSKICTPAKLSTLRSRTRLLSYVNVHKSVELSPKAKSLYKIARDMRKSFKKLDFSCSKLKTKVKKMEDISYTIDVLKSKLNKPSFDLLMSQLRCQERESRGRRYTLDEKILFLSLMKQSPKGYKLIRRLFAAPSRKTLMNLLGNIPFGPGINRAIFESLHTKVESMGESEKLCSILFDEMAIDPRLQYSKKHVCIVGFEDNGPNQERSRKIADKAMVFMATELCKKWKQPLAYYFNEGGMKKDMLATTIKEVVKSCQDCGLKVKAIICDQGAANVAAINLLCKETRDHFKRKNEENRLFGILVSDEEIIPMYDPLHLLKGIRNNVHKYNAKFQWRNNSYEVAKWEHLVRLFNLEKDEDDDYKLCKKLTPKHIENSQKMKVSLAAQTLSNTVAAVMKRLAQNEKYLPKEAEETAEFLLCMDKVFDSVNGATVKSN